MVFQGLSRSQAQAVVAARSWTSSTAADDWKVEFSPLKIVSTSARTFWSPTLVKKRARLHQERRPARALPGPTSSGPATRDRPGQFLHGYDSAWLPAALLGPERRAALADTLFAASRHRGLSLHLNKGLAGAPRRGAGRGARHGHRIRPCSTPSRS